MAATVSLKLWPVVAQRCFGNTGLQVGILGFGAAPIGFANVSDRTMAELLGIAADSGINVIDTAAMYGDSEEKLGRALRSSRNQFLLFTKCGRLLPQRLDPTGFLVRSQRKLRRALRLPDQHESLDWHPRVLGAVLEQSLRRLKTDHVDVIQLHTCSEATLRQGDAVDTLLRARESGKTRYLGFSGDNSAAMFAIQCGKFDCIQISVNVADQQAFHEVLPLAAECGIGVVAKRPVANSAWLSPLRQAQLPSAHNQTYRERLHKLRYGFLEGDRAQELALRFTLGASVHTAIVGTKNPTHLLQNVGYAVAGPLPRSEFDEIRARWEEVSAPTWVGQT